MKNNIVTCSIAVVACMAIINVASATSIIWSGSNAGDIVGPSGSNLGAGNMVLFVWDTGNNGFNASSSDILAGNYAKGDDVLVTQTSGSGLTVSNGRSSANTYTYTYGGAGSVLTAGNSSTHTLNASMAMTGYIVVFDGANLAGSTHYAVSPALFATTLDEPGELNPTPNFSLNSGGILQGAWQPIPEPCSMALFGIGAAAIGLRRRFLKKS